MIDPTQYLKQIQNRDPKLGMLLEAWIDQVSTTFNHLGMTTTGKVDKPAQLAGLNVAAGSDHVHVTITDGAAINKNVQYFVEYAVNDPSFAAPHVEHLGASRGRVLALPAKDGGAVVQQYYFRAYSQYLGGDPQSKHIYYGTRFAPTAVTLSGSSQLTLLSSTGSGTGRADGTQGGAGLGLVIERPLVGPKRSPAPKVT